MDNTIRTDRVDVLDGIRAGAVLIVAFFHFWQQSWYSFEYSSPFLKKLGINAISFDWIHRYGFLFVDLMILITGFCLFLPYARYMVLGTKRPGIPDFGDLMLFYRKRIARIVPSYLFCFCVYLFLIILPSKGYPVWTDFFKDKDLWENIIRQLTFTQNLKTETYIHTPFNMALWTVAVEMQFYLVFPFFAWAFTKKPLITFSAMSAGGYAFITFYVLKKSDGELSSVINQMPAFLGVFALGMISALIFVSLADKLKTRDKYSSVFFTGLAFASLFVIFSIMKRGYGGYSCLQRWQITIRFPMAVLFSIFVVSSCFAAGWYRKIFSNRAAKLLAAISYNFYIWHQPIAVKLKEGRIPYWTGETPPNQTGDRKWMLLYTVIIVAASLTFALCVTYGIEKPFSKLLLKGKKKDEKKS